METLIREATISGRVGGPIRQPGGDEQKTKAQTQGQDLPRTGTKIPNCWKM